MSRGTEAFGSTICFVFFTLSFISSSWIILYNYLAVDYVNMSYSWYDIAQIYNNNELKYKDYSGTNWTTIKIPDENYSYEDIESFMQHSLEKSSHSKPGVELKLVSSIFKVLITLEAMK